MKTYLDVRKINVQGFGSPHGGGEYTELLYELLTQRLGKSEINLINSSAQLADLKKTDLLWSSSPYDLLDKVEIPSKKIFVLHGLRDYEMKKWGLLNPLQALSFTFNSVIKRKKIQKSVPDIFFIFPSIITKYMFELMYQVRISKYCVAAVPSNGLSNNLYSSKMPVENFDPSRFESFITLNADRRVKNFRNTQRAFREIRNLYNPNWELKYTAARPLTSEVGYQYLGFVDKESLANHLRSSILVFPSYSEGYGLPIADAKRTSIFSGSLTLSWEHVRSDRSEQLLVNPDSYLEIAAAMILATCNLDGRQLDSRRISGREVIIKLIEENY